MVIFFYLSYNIVILLDYSPIFPQVDLVFDKHGNEENGRTFYPGIYPNEVASGYDSETPLCECLTPEDVPMSPCYTPEYIPSSPMSEPCSEVEWIPTSPCCGPYLDESEESDSQRYEKPLPPLSTRIYYSMDRALNQYTF